MAKQTTAKRVSARQVAIDVLRAAGEPLKAKEIAKRVIDSGRCEGLKGKTPEATISAMLAVGSKPGGPFKRVDKGTYGLAEMTTATSTPAVQAKPATANKRTQARKPAQAQEAEARIDEGPAEPVALNANGEAHAGAAQAALARRSFSEASR